MSAPAVSNPLILAQLPKMLNAFLCIQNVEKERLVHWNNLAKVAKDCPFEMQVACKNLSVIS